MLNALKLAASPFPSLSLLEKSKAISPGIPFKKPSHSKQKVICIVASFHLKPSVAILTLKLCEGRNKCHALLQQNLNMFTYSTKYK